METFLSSNFILVLCLLLQFIEFHTTTITVNSQCINYFGKSFTYNEFKDIQYKINCIATEGSWVVSQIDTSLSSDYVGEDNWSSICCAPRFCGIKTRCNFNRSINGGSNYIWQFNEKRCQHKKKLYDLNNMLSYLKDYNILVVGDSMSQEFYFTLRNYLHLNYRHQPQCEADDMNQKDGGLKVIFQRNDRLSLMSEYKNISTKKISEKYGENFNEFKFINMVDVLYPNVLVILNRGAHYENDKKTINEINNTLHYLYTTYKDINILWRNTAIGHMNYHHNNVIDSIPLVLPPQYDETTGYNYGKFIGQNYNIKQFLSHNYPQVLYMDVHYSTQFRQDLHYDAIHYCIPGPIDNWVHNILYHSLEIVTTSNATCIIK